MSPLPPPAIPVLFYQDVRKALEWLEENYNFIPVVRFEDENGGIVHAEMKLGGARIMIGPSNLVDWAKSPAALQGQNSQQTYIYVDDIMAHHAGAEMMGATITVAPEEQFYGDKTYRSTDLEGHRWVFAQKCKDVSKAEMAEATGLKVT